MKFNFHARNLLNILKSLLKYAVNIQCCIYNSVLTTTLNSAIQHTIMATAKSSDLNVWLHATTCLKIMLVLHASIHLVLNFKNVHNATSKLTIL
jgi:hypothetical protein